MSSFSLNSSYDLSDPRFGVQQDCDICKKRRCEGHFATLELGTYIIHPMFFKVVGQRIKNMCINCGEPTPVKKSRSYKCKYCNNIIDKDTPKLEDMYSTDGDVLFKIKELFNIMDFREYHFIIRRILVPPPGLRPKNDLEWPSDMSQSYSALIKTIRGYKKSMMSAEYRNVITKYYSRIVVGGRGSTTEKILSGKEGIFRGIMKGKRLDNSARSVITGDPNINVDEILIPKMIANKITISETCSMYNAGSLKKDAAHGRVFWDKRGSIAEVDEIMEGQKYERLLRDGDMVLFNRQPSLSRDSLMSFKIKTRCDDNLTISMNQIVASSFNADFDGDEMNIFANWDLRSQAELVSLCNVRSFNSLRPIQDTITGSYLLTHDNVLVDRMTIMDCVTTIGESMINGNRGIDLFMLSIPKDMRSGMNISFPVRKDDICGSIPKYIIRSKGDPSIFYENLQKIVCIWISRLGFNISAYDCMWSKDDVREKNMMSSYVNKNEYMDSQRRFLEWVYDKCSRNYNSGPMYKMIESGSKGNIINMSQIMASVGHQYITDDYGNNYRDTLVDMGLVKSSYIDGLDPDEFMLHLVASRTGVINTGVQTSSTGYLSRRASMIMADCNLDYTGVVCENDRLISMPDLSKSRHFNNVF